MADALKELMNKRGVLWTVSCAHGFLCRGLRCGMTLRCLRSVSVHLASTVQWPECNNGLLPVWLFVFSSAFHLCLAVDVHRTHRPHLHLIHRLQELPDLQLSTNYQLSTSRLCFTLLTSGVVRKDASLSHPVLITCSISFVDRGISRRSTFAKYVGSLLPKRKAYLPFTILKRTSPVTSRIRYRC